MTKFCSAFLLVATVVADAADDLLTLMNDKKEDFKTLLAGAEDAITPDAISPLFEGAGGELKVAAELEADAAGAIDYKAMAKILILVKQDADANITDANVNALIDTVQSADPEKKDAIVADISTFLKEVAPEAVVEEITSAPTEEETAPTEAPVEESAAEATTAAAVDGADEDEDGDEDDEEENSDAQSASFNFALSSALLSIVV